MVEGILIRIVWYYLYQQDASSLGSPFHKNSTVKRACLGVVFGWVTCREVFPVSVRVRTKHAEKTRVGL